MDEAVVTRPSNSSTPHRSADEHRIPTRAVSTPLFRTKHQTTRNERQTLLHRRSASEHRESSEDPAKAQPVAGGTVLGIHNLAIVIPQFVVSFFSFLFPFFGSLTMMLDCHRGKRDLPSRRRRRRLRSHQYIFWSKRRCVGPSIWRRLCTGESLF